ncbi:hypothetical protein [Arcicella rosea]|uniref:CDP-Glycerol:Poly(Glycerophosphate) glycerophosphotransferase n=1 Tax=Arcicella rosea TaxID=502909 RepID=A0A841EJM7_9BACT|nr:hypothetical protein [Arcicella rosea]MBB6002414.1 hypothetical protein [Arcicella rosea]
MTDNNYFQKYIELKKKFGFLYKEIDLGKALAHDIAKITFNQNSANQAIEIFHNIFYKIDFNQLKKSMASNKIVCIYSVDRLDYKYQLEQTFKYIDSSEIWILSDFSWKKSFNILRILKAFFYTLEISCSYQLNFKQIIFLASRLVYYKNLCDQLYQTFDKFDNEGKVFVAFNSAFTVENLLTQFFRGQDVRTISLSHCIFTSYKSFVPLDIINLENIVSEKLLVWGESSRNYLINHFGASKDSIEVAGNPKYSLKVINVKQSFKKGVVLLGRKIYEESNFDIVNILKKLLHTLPNICLELKLHLSLDSAIYKKLCEGTNISVIEGKESLNELFEKKGYDFAIVNNSTAYYEAMYYDMVCFRYEPSENEKFEGLDDYFHDTSSLLDRISMFQSTSSENLNFHVERVLTEAIGMGINRYKELLES